MASWAGTYQLNIAALRGFIAGVHNAGATATVGIYSTSAQWKDITGLTAQTTPTAFNGQLPDWSYRDDPLSPIRRPSRRGPEACGWQRSIPTSRR
jgi:hypothetical protein